jgi:transcriptional regulator with XRE-family HTH domain
MIEIERNTKEAAARDIGRQLSRKLAEQGLTQDGVAAKLSLSQAWVSRILNGQFTERSIAARTLCERFGIPFLGECGARRRVPPSRQRVERLHAAIKQISDGQVADLITALKAIQRGRQPRRAE